MGYRDTDWYKAQKHVRNWLNAYGIVAHNCEYLSPFDLKTEGGKRIEVKFAKFCPQLKGWAFNIHRHGVISEQETDVYVLRCEPGEASNVLGEHSFHLVLPAPINTKVVRVTARQLMCGKWSQHYNNVELLLS